MVRKLRRRPRSRYGGFWVFSARVFGRRRVMREGGRDWTLSPAFVNRRRRAG